MSPTTVAIISGLFGLIGGAIGSLIAPWVQWGIEKRREKLNHKRALIQDWRRHLGSHYTKESFPSSLTYNGMKPYLSNEAVELVENNSAPDLKGIDIKRRILNEINRIEKEWSLM